MTDLRLERRDALTAAERERIVQLVDDTTRSVGASPLSDTARLRLQHGTDGVISHFLLLDDVRIVGYAQLEPGADSAPATVELVTEPSDDRDYPRALVAAINERLPQGVLAWAHGTASPLARLAEELGLPVQRRLLVLRRDLADPLPEAVWPVGVTVRTFVVGQDEAAWLEVNRRAFARHPEQGTWTRDELEQREAEPWFDPAGFFLAERGGRLVGFHWTKVHADGRRAGAPIGEVYVVGVDPDLHGEGLGAALTLQGLHHLQQRGLPQVMLYVDEDNQAARRLYDRLDFTLWDSDSCVLLRH